jgi:hypothetical protein
MARNKRIPLLLGLLGGAADPAASFTVTTTGAQTLTIQTLTVSASTVVDWGDGSNDTYTGTGTRTHAYAGAGTWQMRIMQPLNVTYFDLRDTKATCAAGTIRKMSNLTVLIMLGGVTVATTAGEIGSLVKLTDVLFDTLPNLVIGAGEVGRLVNLTYLSMGAVSGVAPQAGFENLTKLGTLTYQNVLSQAQVDAVLIGLWTAAQAGAKANGGVITMASGNAAPSGVYGAANPPTTGKAAAYELINDSAGVIPAGKEWTTITVTGGLP